MSDDRDEGFVLPARSPAAQARVEAALDLRRDLPEAAPDALPQFLVSPPWANRVAPSKPVVVKGLSAPSEASVAWADGERESWAATPFDERPYGPDDEHLASLYAEHGYPGAHNAGRFACRAAEALIRPLLESGWQQYHQATYDADGALLATFRVAEDLTFADLDDEAFTPAEPALVGVVHPLELGELIPRWSDMLADYEILQPFAQLGRPTYALTEEEREASDLKRFQGIEVPAGKVVGLTRRGWRRGEAWDNGSQAYISRPLSDGRALIMNITPGISVGMVQDSEDQTIADTWIARDGRPDWMLQKDRADPFGTLDPVTASEILRDLTEVTEMTEVTAQ